MTRDDVIKFLRAHHTPKRMTVSGTVERDTVAYREMSFFLIDGFVSNREKAIEGFRRGNGLSIKVKSRLRIEEE